MNTFSLYIHIPFCRFRCDYCDFFTRTRVAPVRQREIIASTVRQALDAHTTWHAPAPHPGTIYVGGGTPSALDPAAAELLLEGISALRTRLAVHGVSTEASSTAEEIEEITVEVNPEDVNPALLARYADAGVTRLSVGIQSLREQVLRRIGRHTTLDATRRGLETVATHWPGRWSADLITAIPGDDPDGAAADATELLRFGPRHLSVYELGIEPATLLGMRHRRNAIPPISETGQIAQSQAVSDVLGAAGLRRYEVSSWSLPGEESRHNLRYWRLAPWAAAGPGAVGLVPRGGGPEHVTVPRSFPRFLSREDFGVHREPLTARDLFEETLMGGMRTTDGVNRTRIEAVFGRRMETIIPDTLDRWSALTHAPRAEHLALTADGLLLLNRFLVDAFAELDTTASLLRSPPAWPDSASPDATAT